MTTELDFHDKKIPVTFISSDQKAIPQLLSVLANNKVYAASENIERIEIIGNQAILHTSKENENICLSLF